jgi:NAD(P)-dependent dehydrogenase (short-subunit alcohol dehydrogenase family)
MSLQDKKIVLLGGTSGFGLATAIAASNQGASVAVVSSRQASVDKALAALSTGAEGYALDLRDEASYETLFNKIGNFDHLIYTAGDKLSLAPLDQITIAQARDFFELRYWGAFMAAKYGSPYINQGGSIVLTNGIVGLRPWKGWAAAASVAGAVESLTRALAVELAPIRVNAVCAGVINTNLWAGMSEAERKGFFDNTAKSLPAGRIGEAEDIAQAFLFLMNEGFSTGQTIVVDGGAILV